MDGKRPPGRRVVVYDAEGYFVGPGIAELLANEGFETHLVTSLDVVSPISDLTLEGPMLRQHLHEAGRDDAPRRDGPGGRAGPASRARTSSRSRGRSRRTGSCS